MRQLLKQESNWTIVRCAALLAPCLLCASPTEAGEPAKDWKHLEVRSSRPRPPFKDVEHGDTMYASWLGGGVRKDADDQLTAYVMSISHHFLRERRKSLSYGIVGYPPLRKGDLVPVYNHVYEVTELQDGPRDFKDGGHRIEMKWVPEDKLPVGVALGDHSLLFPLGGKSGGDVVPLVGNTIVDNYSITPTSIEAVPDKGTAAGKLLAKLEIQYHHKLTRTGSEYHGAVQKGDALRIGARYFKVRNVVPRDPKTKVIGWIELAPESTPKEDLVRDKVRLVDPQPKKD